MIAGRVVAAVKPAFGLLCLMAAMHFAHPHSLHNQRQASVVFRKSLTAGANTPMRAEMSTSYRRHGITYYTQAHVVQGAGGKCRIEYVSPPEARGRIVFSDGIKSWQYEPGHNELRETRLDPLSEQREHELEQLIEANYSLDLVSSIATIEGRSAYIIDLIPKHQGKSRQRRWIDRHTYRTLRSETHYTDGILARMVSYDHLALPASVSDADFKPMQAAALRSVSGLELAVSTPDHLIPDRFKPCGLKPQALLGFALLEISSGEINGLPATQFLYSDGIETVSIFKQKSAAIKKVSQGWHRITLQGSSAFENTDHHVYALAWLDSGNMYTAVSHLTPAALRELVAGQIHASQSEQPAP